MFDGEVKERRSQPAVALSTSASASACASTSDVVVPHKLLTPKHRRDHSAGGLGLGLRRKAQAKDKDKDKDKDRNGVAGDQSFSSPSSRTCTLPKGSKADLARRIKSLTRNAGETRSSTLDPGQIQALQEEALARESGESQGRGDNNNATEVNEEEEKETTWARTTWFQVYEGKIIQTQDAPSREHQGNVFSSSSQSSTIFYQNMLSSGQWMSSERLTVYDIGLLVRSRVTQQRCFAYDVIKRILETSVHVDSMEERFAYENAVQYFVRVGGLHETLISDMNGSNTRACQCSLAVISDILLPSLLANYLAQKKSFLSYKQLHSHSSSASPSSKQKTICELYQKGLAEKISKDCILSEIMRSNANSEPFSLSLVKVMLALEVQGITSYLGSRSHTVVILSFLSSRLQQAESMSTKVHIVWLLCVISERDPAILSEHLGDEIFDRIEDLYHATRSKGSCSYMEYTMQTFALHFQNAYLSKYWNKSWDTLAQVCKPSNQGTQAIPIDNSSLILIENLFSMLSKGMKTNVMKESQLVKAISSARVCLELVLQTWKAVDEKSDRFLYCLSAISSGVLFYEHLLSNTRAQGVEPKDRTTATESLHNLLIGVIPELVKCCSRVFKDLVHQDIKQGKVIQGFDMKHSGTKFLHSTWHKVVCDFLLLSLKPLWGKGTALESAWNVLETHRRKTFVIHSDEDLKDCHATIFSELLANHYNLLGTAIDVFLNSSGTSISLEKMITSWDCAADALYWSGNTNQFLSAQTLFPTKILAGILAKRKEILQKYMNGGAFPLNGVGPNLAQKFDDIDAMDIARKVHAVVLNFKSRELSPDWMFDLQLCDGKQELYPLILLFLLCVELSGSRYLLGLPVNMKLSKILAEAYCRSDSLFKEESALFMPLVVGFHLSQMDNEMNNIDASIITQRGYGLRLSTSIIDQFTSVSYGDTLFGLVASLAFSNAQSIPDQMEAWKNVAAGDSFDLFPPISYYGDLVKFFFGLPRSINLVESCFDTLLRPSMRKAVKKECITAFFAFHYVCDFCFTEMNEDNCHKSKLQLSEALSKQKKLIHQALVFLDETMLQLLFRYSFEDFIPTFKDFSQRKIEMWKRIVGPDRLPSFLAHFN